METKLFLNQGETAMVAILAGGLPSIQKVGYLNLVTVRPNSLKQVDTVSTNKRLTNVLMSRVIWDELKKTGCPVQQYTCL